MLICVEPRNLLFQLSVIYIFYNLHCGGLFLYGAKMQLSISKIITFEGEDIGFRLGLAYGNGQRSGK